MPAAWGRESPAPPPITLDLTLNPVPSPTTDDYMSSKVQYVNNDILTDCVLAKDFKVCNPIPNPKP
jgi:hypothetical protein